MRIRLRTAIIFIVGIPFVYFAFCVFNLNFLSILGTPGLYQHYTSIDDFENYFSIIGGSNYRDEDYFLLLKQAFADTKIQGRMKKQGWFSSNDVLRLASQSDFKRTHARIIRLPDAEIEKMPIFFDTVRAPEMRATCFSTDSHSREVWDEAKAPFLSDFVFSLSNTVQHGGAYFVPPARDLPENYPERHLVIKPFPKALFTNQEPIVLDSVEKIGRYWNTAGE